MEHGYFPTSRQPDVKQSSQDDLLKVLVIDDQPYVLRTAVKMLHDLGYFSTIDTANDGEAGWNKIKGSRTNQFDVVITDIYMPKLDGIGLINRCHGSTFARDIPFLVITGETDPSILAVLGEMGVRDCLVKPFSFQLFQDRMNTVLQKMKDPVEKSYTELTHIVKDGHYQEASLRLEQLNKEEATKPRWLNLKGEIYLGLGELDLARDCIEMALMFCDSYLTALCNHAKLEEKSGNLAAAVESLEKADAISPLMVDRKIALSDLLFQINRNEDAREMLCKTALITKDVQKRLQISEILSEKGYDKEANNIIKRVLSLKYTNIETSNRIGITLRKQCKFREAEKSYMTTLDYLPDNAVIYYNLGILYLYEERKSEAFDCFKKALAQDPCFSEAKEMLDYYFGPESGDNMRSGIPYPKEVYDV